VRWGEDKSIKTNNMLMTLLAVMRFKLAGGYERKN